MTPELEPETAIDAVIGHTINSGRFKIAWSMEWDDTLRAEHGNGCSFSQIADILNKRYATAFTRNAVIGRATRLGLAKRKAASSPKRATAVPVSAELADAAKLAATRPSTIPAGSEASRLSHALKRQKRGTDPHMVDTRPIRCAAVEPLHLSILDLTDCACRWPCGGWPEATRITFCGHPTIGGESYCDVHRALSLAPAPIRNAHPHRADKAA